MNVLVKQTLPLPSPFAILGTPRSRTAWLAQFLSHGSVQCEHEPSWRWKDSSEMASWFRPGVGCVDSMLTLKWEEVDACGVRILVIRRRAEGIRESAERIGVKVPEGLLKSLRYAIARMPYRIKVLRYEDMGDKQWRGVFEWVYGSEVPWGWWLYWKDRKVEKPYAEAEALVKANAGNLQSFYGEALVR